MVVTGDFPKDIAEHISFEKNSISTNMYKTQMHAEFVEFYLTFVMNVVKKEYTRYRPFDMEKLTIVMDEFPKASAYYYIANNLLQTKDEAQFAEIIGRLLEIFPDVELNDRLIAKFEVKP
ncbi:MAG: hypothetical protein AAF705_12485 [Bacteroidota bacterium]